MNLKKISALSLALVLSAGITVNATGLPSTEKSEKEEKKIELRQGSFRHKHHDGGLYSTAKEIGITKEEMKEAKEKGANFFEMAKKKGYTKQQVQEMMIKNKSQALDKKVEDGKITKEKAEEIKTKLKERIESWDGTLRKKADMKKDSKEQ